MIWKVNLMVRPSGAYRTAKQGIKNTCVVSSLAVQVFKRYRKISAKAGEIGLSCMPTTKTWGWGDTTGNQLREGLHRYVKAVYYDKWDPRVTVADPYILVVTGDLARA